MGISFGSMVSLSKKGFLILATMIWLPLALLAEGKRDTTIVVSSKKGDKIVKAQIYNLDTNNRMVFYKPKSFEFVTNVPSDFVSLYKTTVKKSNLATLGLVLGSTAVLVAFDQPITDAVHRFGNYIGLDPARNFKRISLNMGKSSIPVMDVPQNLNSAFYFLGEGWPSILVAGSYLGYGLIGHDYRAQQTASQLFEMFFTLAVTVQSIKRIAGRESPFQASQPGGTWRPFTNPAVYQHDVSKHDAFPSGHFATIMATITIIAGNYPDNPWVKPIGYSLMGLCGFAMVHNGVHWMGDYPLAIAIGYASGRIALARGHHNETKTGALWGKNASLVPISFGNGGLGFSYSYAF